MKLRLFEFEDLWWFPDVIRNGMTDFLRYIFITVNFYEPITDIIIEGLNKTGQQYIVDLCSGGGGGIKKVYDNLKLINNKAIFITLTDKFPNLGAYEYLKQKTDGDINYICKPVDAMNVPASVNGLRVLFSGFHHFNTHHAKLVLKDAVDAKKGIAIFDGGDKNLINMLLVLLLLPLAFILITPFIRPFRFSRLFYTYICPVIPFCTVWDGSVSITRLHQPAMMLKMANEVDAVNYIWKTGKRKIS